MVDAKGMAALFNDMPSRGALHDDLPQPLSCFSLAQPPSPPCHAIFSLSTKHILQVPSLEKKTHILPVKRSFARPNLLGKVLDVSHQHFWFFQCCKMTSGIMLSVPDEIPHGRNPDFRNRCQFLWKPGVSGRLIASISWVTVRCVFARVAMVL